MKTKARYVEAVRLQTILILVVAGTALTGCRMTSGWVGCCPLQPIMTRWVEYAEVGPPVALMVSRDICKLLKS